MHSMHCIHLFFACVLVHELVKQNASVGQFLNRSTTLEHLAECTQNLFAHLSYSL